MLEVLTPTMIDYARPELASEMVLGCSPVGSPGVRASRSQARAAIWLR